jgi:hypothetical protein
LALLLPIVDYGTIVLMRSHRIRLTDEELAVVVSALRARVAGLSTKRGRAVAQLATRLAECTPGNPYWILDLDAELSLKPEEVERYGGVDPNVQM